MADRWMIAVTAINALSIPYWLVTGRYLEGAIYAAVVLVTARFYRWGRR